MKEHKTIQGVDFEVKHLSPDDLHKLACSVVSRVKSLDDCYKRPSYSKQYIYNMWMEWSNNVVDMYTFDIDTYNTHIFTLSGVIEYSFGMVEIIHITPTRHILYTA